MRLLQQEGSQEQPVPAQAPRIKTEGKWNEWESRTTEICNIGGRSTKSTKVKP
jgi:hypothetical protein